MSFKVIHLIYTVLMAFAFGWLIFHLFHKISMF